MQRAAAYAAALSLIPTPVLAPMVRVLNRTLRRRHPGLVKEFGRLDPAVVYITLTDVPHRFKIAYGNGRMDVAVLTGTDPPPPDAAMRGSLATMIDLLEGRIDSDAMFFTRDLQVTGSTAVSVAVRNTLDREVIDLRDDIAAAFGPFERPARRIGRRLDGIAGWARRQAIAFHRTLHAEDAPPRDLAAETDALRQEVKALTARLAKLDVRQQKRADRPAVGAA
ncbi:MAG: SCP2 sterol-binding domain-containing protein [Acetobacteraceae bacterium]